MPPPKDVKLGSLTQVIRHTSKWGDVSEFPAFQAWADEVEKVLSFLVAHGMFERFLPRLRARESERDAALAEARAAFFFARNGFRILAWEPEAVAGRPGDLEIQWTNTEPIFVEVKGPGWEGELSKEEIAAGRQHGLKYINAEGRAVGPIGRVVYCLGKSVPKFDPKRVNLVVVVDDLFISPTELPKDYLQQSLQHELAAPEYAKVGGVFLLNPASHSGPIEYRKFFVPNTGALVQMPALVLEGLLAGNTDPQGPRWLRK